MRKILRSGVKDEMNENSAEKIPIRAGSLTLKFLGMLPSSFEIFVQSLAAGIGDMTNSSGVTWRTFLGDFLILGIGGLILLIFAFAVTPTRRGFFCEDESIRYPFKGSTVPNWLLYIYGFSIPITVILITEFLVNWRVRASGMFLCRPAPVWIISIYRSLVDFLFGCVCSQVITDIGKYSIGRLRPNFISVCKPDLDLQSCFQYGNTYLTNYVCTKGNNDAAESRVSFPSGHTSFSAFAMLYIAIFVQVKVQVGRNATLRLFKHGFQLAVILLSYFTGLSRVMDNKHHWSDVLAGALIGSITAAIIARYVSGLLEERYRFKRQKPSDDSMDSKRGHQLDINPDIEATAPTEIPARQHSVTFTKQSSLTK
ncbi:unnamed protein product [Allacma fusca]|uniref:Phosphatidic acid phosphatase type 2/haloperoxidase domain-containing protein n=1 Tax=Allacma fusca TaxID=39272 RepID=A0A8J2NY14_9HEXA|nr:unnamed protein product [Allacma fusca]